MNIIPTLKYAWQTTVHKWFVFRAGLKIGVPLYQLLVHDLSKYTPAELPHYGRQFYGDKSDPVGFNIAWLHHQNVNAHHWEYWIPRTGHSRCVVPFPDDTPLAMSDNAAREMVTDWFAACRAYEGRWPEVGNWGWLAQNWWIIKKRMHPVTVDISFVEITRFRQLPGNCLESRRPI